jgi:hypothetical protein
MRLPPVVAKRIAACLTLMLSVALLPPVAWAHVSIGHHVQASLHAGWALRRLDRDRDVRRPLRGAAGPGERPAQGSDDGRGERHDARGMAQCVYVPSAPRLRRAKTAYRTATRRSIVTQAGRAFVARMLDPASRPRRGP